MKIMDFLNEKAVSADLKATDKEGVIKELMGLLVKAGEIKQKDEASLVKVLLEREELGSTGIGQGIGIPHGKSPVVRRMTASFGISHKGVDFDSLDGEPAFIFFLLMAPSDSAGPHLKALARISRLLKDKFFRDSLRQVRDEKELLRVIKDEDLKRH